MRMPQPMNRTGIATSPDLARSLVRATQAMPHVASNGGADGVAQMRVSYAKKSEPVGSLPPAKMQSPMLGDKLGERLAFERSGVRLYDGLISKLAAFGSWPGGPSKADLEQIREEERQHFTMLRDLMKQMGADPTAVTPGADLQAVMTQGIVSVIADPRTNLRQCLEAIVVVELADNDCWDRLGELARAAGMDRAAAMFDTARMQERDHLRRVRAWLRASLDGMPTNGASPRKRTPARRSQKRKRRR